MFTFDLDSEDLFEERAKQFVGAWGIPAPIVTRARARIRDMWSDQAGGWTPEWGREAETAESHGDWLLAALCWGAAKFPTIATPIRAEAFGRQLAAYEKAAPSFPVSFERRRLVVAGPDGATEVAAHIFQRRRRRRDGLLVICGGVDTWKVELHNAAVRMARLTGFAVVALDNPGTGETTAPISPHADRIVAETISAVASGSGPVGMVGVSFAGLWAAKLALDGRVDAAISLGGPVGAQIIQDVRALPNGMPGILAHAAQLNELPAVEDYQSFITEFSLRRQGYFDRPPVSPVLAINGDHDHFVPLADTTVFTGLPGCEAWVVRDGTHCAPERLSTIMPPAVMWLIARMTGSPLDKAGAALLKPLAMPSLRQDLA
ncbi:alpha/beta fold hydrolase [Mycobacteroides immunogenum]|uniref:alpha/beta fold hydrolase n=1 Tax=Mycobacteroides immunogenum TaxID=83262 RepID=UPI0025B740AA|nr:alpha/beta fold hydrolase [Mycobacteroides immunogenum]WJR33782.1 alpha/beta fold hydrolase [Mycobacteroides immunogenum]